MTFQKSNSVSLDSSTFLFANLLTLRVSLGYQSSLYLTFFIWAFETGFMKLVVNNFAIILYSLECS